MGDRGRALVPHIPVHNARIPACFQHRPTPAACVPRLSLSVCEHLGRRFPRPKEHDSARVQRTAHPECAASGLASRKPAKLPSVRPSRLNEEFFLVVPKNGPQGCRKSTAYSAAC
jgi:hypothetical protein